MKNSTILKCTVSAIALVFASSGAALGQAAQVSSDSGSGVGEIIVTGSRVATGVDAPTPVTVVTPAAINETGRPNFADALVQLPALRSSTTSSTGGQGATIGAQLNLRGLGGFRTLTLVDGQRWVGTPQFITGQGQAVNIDALPQGLIKRVDTVTGGASAAYGSDAVAGVVNFVLDDTFEGLKGDVSYGETQRNDGIKYSAVITAGGAFGDGRGHLVFNGEYAVDEGIYGSPFGGEGKVARKWELPGNTFGIGTTPDGLLVTPNATYYQFPLNALVTACKTTGGVQLGVPKAAPCPLYNTSFNNAGTATQAYNTGTITAATDPFAIGGDGYEPGGQSFLSTPTTRYTLFGRVGYDVTPKLNVYFNMNYGDTYSLSRAGQGTPSLVSGSVLLGVPVDVNYAYLPANLKASMIANNIQSINIEKVFQFQVRQTIEDRTQRFVAGAKYQLNDNWSADLYTEYGLINSSLQLNNFTNTIALKNALTAVKDPVTGAITCTALAGPACVPYNIFGRTLLTPAQDAYLNPTDFYFTRNNQQVVEGAVKGSPFSLPAGPVDIAFGAGYRKEILNESTDTLGLAGQTNPFNGNSGALIYINSPAIKGSLHLEEAFGEAQVPILKNAPFSKSLELNLAGRYTNYSTSGGVPTYKAGVVWEPIDGVRFRVAQSRDVRAANVVELFSPPSSSFANVRDPFKAGASVTLLPVTSGNDKLTPEKADTTTIGVVFNPSFLPGASASLDYYGIVIRDVIGNINSQKTLDLCFGNPTAYADLCKRITRNAGGDVTSIATPYSNLASAHNSGFDLELNYRRDVNLFGRDSRISLRSFTTYIVHNSVTTPGSPPSTTDQASAVGRVVSLLMLGYETGPWRMGVQEHYVHGGRFSVQYPEFGNNRGPGQATTDISLTRKMGGTKWEMYGSVINLFDRNPGAYPYSSVNSGSGTSGAYDTQGRRFQIGARFKL